MSLRRFSIHSTLLAAAISVTALHPLRADEPKPAVAAPAQAEPKPEPATSEAPTPNLEDGRPVRGPGRPREGGVREGGPREGGPRRGGEGGPRPQGGMNMNETPEQRQERTARLLQPYVDILPDLTEEQKTHILVILEASNSEVRAVRFNTTLPEARRLLMVTKVRGFLPERIKVALTDPQIATYTAAVAEQEEIAAEMAKVGSVRPDEDVEQMRARLLQGYEPVLEELSVKQKTQIIKILEAAGEESQSAKADAGLTPAQKLVALRKIHDGISAKVLPLLDAEQKQTWKKAHDAMRP